MHTLAQPARSVHAHYAVSQAWPSRVASLAQPCRGPPLGRVACIGGHVAGLTDRVVGCITTHPALRPCACAMSRAAAHVAAPNVVSWRTVAVSQLVSQPYCYIKPPPAMIQSLYCGTPHGQAMRARCRTPLA